MYRPLLVLLLVLLAPASQAAEDLWLLVDTAVQRLTVFRGHERVTSFDNISIGRNGTSWTRLRGDETTPLGEFHIMRINRDSRFNIFLELDFPTPHHADLALQAGLIDFKAYEQVRDQVAATGRPPQTTALGGNIGLHGLGEADPDIHARFNWTEGCIALTNAQIERLATMVGVGTRVFIR